MNLSQDPTTPRSTLLQTALHYASYGWAVFPLLPHGKTPLTANGFKAATTDVAQITTWWTNHPDANIGIATGAVSNLVVLDFDAKSGGLPTYDDLVKSFDALPTAVVRTGGGGRHLYFTHPGEPVRNKAGYSQGMDVRGDGGYVVAPPSIHENGESYRWDNAAFTVGPLPGFLLKGLTERAKPLSDPGRAVTPNEVQEGGRNHYLTKVAGALQRQGILTYAGLSAVNDEKCVPPLPEWEVKAVFNSISRHEPTASLVGTPEKGKSGDEDKPVATVLAQDLAAEMLVYLGDKAKVKGKPTYMAELDKLLGGGKRLGEVTCWHAEAKVGKNTLWHFLMWMWLEDGIPIGYASRELTPSSDVLPNILSCKFLENAWTVELTPERSAKYAEALTKWPLYFAGSGDEAYGYFSFEQIEKWVDDCRAKGVEYFWFDHLHYMLEDPEEHRDASKLIKRIKAMAKAKNIHVDIIIQPNKLAEGQTLGLNSVKGGSAMGQAVDNIITLEREKEKDGEKTDVTKVTLKVARCKLARPGDFYLQYFPETMVYQKTEKQPPEASPRDLRPLSKVALYGEDKRLS